MSSSIPIYLFPAKIRRLYDITNIFVTLRLIQKVNVAKQGSKPAFIWTGGHTLPSDYLWEE
jgi:hypothetical protein